MKQFIKNIVKFSTLFLIPISIGVLGNFIILNSTTYWKLPNSEENIVLGHSHPECAFNDSIIPNFVNLSASGEAYLYTYIKLKKIIENNEQLKNVFIEFESYNINEKMNSWTWGDEQINYNLPKYLPIIDLSEMKVLFKNNTKSVLSITPKRLMKEIGFTYYNLLLENNNVISSKRKYGGYLHLVRDKTDSLIIANKSNNNDIDNKDIKSSEINIFYLKKILDLCERNEVEAYLIRSPVHDKYSNPQTEKLFIDILKNRFTNSVFLDFKEFPLENNEFGDFGHLNYKGAAIFSQWFAQQIQNNFLEKKNRHEFIDEKIKARLHYKMSNEIP